MRLGRGRPARRRAAAVFERVVFLGAAAALTAGCSATPPATGPPPPSPSVPARSSPPARAAHPARPTQAAGGFTVAGDNPVQANGSQDTYAATPGAVCSGTRLAADKALGGGIVAGFRLQNFPVAADLLSHFLQGSGTPVDYGAGSAIARQAAASGAFATVNAQVQSEVAVALKDGATRVRLSAGQLPTVYFGSTSSDLYWGFRGTQGLSVTGSGSRRNGGYAGTLTYVIRDSYGFPVNDTLGGFGAPMRYLQTVCGAPQHAGGAHWFPDSITVTVPFTG
jgi:hypothetical protein